MHDGNENGVVTKRRLEFVQIDQAITFRRQVGHFKTFALQLPATVQHRLVLGLAGNNMFAFFLVEMRGALDSQIVGLGCAGGPDDFPGIGID